MADHPKLCYPLKYYIVVTQVFWSAHLGLDFGWNGSVQGGCNQDIIAIADGTVVTAVDGYGNTYPNSRIYGNYVIVSHGGGWYSLYGHLLKGLKVKAGDKVKQGQTLGYMGNTGYSNGQHLHFELRKGGNSKAYAVDPMPWLLVMPSVAHPVVSKNTLAPDKIRYDELIVLVGAPVQKDSGRDQIEITSTVVNGRLYPRLSGSRWGYINAGTYNIHDRVEADGYAWYLLEANVNGIGDALWVAYSPDWAVLYLVETGTAVLEAEIEQLKAQITAVRAENERVAQVIEAVRAAVA